MGWRHLLGGGWLADHVLARIASMNSKHTKTLKAIFSNPVNGNSEWSHVEGLRVGLGCRVIAGSGSSVTFGKDGEKVFFHRPTQEKKRFGIECSKRVNF